MSATLVRCVLAECDASAEPHARAARLRPEFEFSELRLAHGAVGEPDTTVDVGFGLALYVVGTDAIVVQIDARFQLLFRSPAPPSPAARHSIVCEQAPAEAWPQFRAHVDRVLAEMGMPPFHGTHILPLRIAGLAVEVREETALVDRRIAERRE